MSFTHDTIVIDTYFNRLRPSAKYLLGFDILVLVRYYLTVNPLCLIPPRPVSLQKVRLLGTSFQFISSIKILNTPSL